MVPQNNPSVLFYFRKVFLMSMYFMYPITSHSIFFILLTLLDHSDPRDYYIITLATQKLYLWKLSYRFPSSMRSYYFLSLQVSSSLGYLTGLLSSASCSLLRQQSYINSFLIMRQGWVDMLGIYYN